MTTFSVRAFDDVGDNATGGRDVDEYDVIARTLLEKVFIGTMLSVVVLVTIGGNALVCVTVVKTRRLHTMTNFLVVSLAVADLLLAILVLPLSALTTITGGVWSLGPRLCNIHVATDVTLCTVSIVTLFAISLDRYVAVTSPFRYQKLADTRLVRRVTAAIWVSSTVLAFVPIHMGWNTVDGRVQNAAIGVVRSSSAEESCVFEVNRPYAVIVAMGTYFVPLVIMCVVYVRILSITRRQVREINKMCLLPVGRHRMTSPVINGSNPVEPERSPRHCPAEPQTQEPRSAIIADVDILCERQLRQQTQQQEQEHDVPLDEMGHVQFRRKIASDRKATMTLASVVVAFGVCWVPYFALFTVKPFASRPVNHHVEIAVTWLGYCNSSVNPFLYAFCSSTFRRGFTRILRCRR